MALWFSKKRKQKRRWERGTMQKEFRNTRINEAITEVVGAADAVAPATTAPAAVAATKNSMFVIEI